MMNLFRALSVLFLLVCPVTQAATETHLFPDSAGAGRVVLENESFRYTVLVEKGVYLERAVEKSIGTDYLQGNPPLMMVSSRDDGTAHPGYQLFRLKETTGASGPAVEIYQESAYVENPLSFIH